MITAVLSDVHGNLTALEAVLRDIQVRGADRVICLGDMVGKGPRSRQVLDLCRRECDVIVKGNWEDGLYHNFRENMELVRQPFRWYMEQIGEKDILSFPTLPLWTEGKLADKLVRLFHAHPEGFTRYFAYSPRDQLLELLEPPTDAADQRRSDIAIYGDIHIVYQWPVDCRLILNVGSVGNPLDMPGASYLLLEDCPGQEDYSLHFRRLPYDIDGEVACTKTSGHPDGEAYIREITTGRYRGAK